MRILLFISVFGHGRGGHFHSLNHIANALGSVNDIAIYSIGLGTSDVIKNNQFFVDHLAFNTKNFFSFKTRLNIEIANFKPDVIHCFDLNAYNIIKLTNKFKQVKYVLNKCGGPNPKNFPVVENIILFSQENLNWFNKHEKYKEVAKYLIPNRVNKEELIVVNDNPTILKEKSFCFVRIARIGSAYIKSFEDSINLIKDLHLNKLNVHLYIIGAIESKSIFDQLMKLCEQLPITVITDDCYTKKASNMLYLADAVIATGRGIMEAAALSKPILTVAKNSNLPILINKINFRNFFSTNFSPRNIAEDCDLTNNFSDILRLINQKDALRESSELSNEVFSEYFDVRGTIGKYNNVYENAIDRSTNNISWYVVIKSKLSTLYKFSQKK